MERERERERQREKLTAGADGDAVSVTGSFNLERSEGKVVGLCSDFSDFTLAAVTLIALQPLPEVEGLH